MYIYLAFWTPHHYSLRKHIREHGSLPILGLAIVVFNARPTLVIVLCPISRDNMKWLLLFSVLFGL